MAKKSLTPTLSFRDLVLGADAEVLCQAYQARARIEELLTERQAAYERIAALETQIEEIVGEPGVFPFPPPPLPVAGLDTKGESVFRAAAGNETAGGKRLAKRANGSDAVMAANPNADASTVDLSVGVEGEKPERI